MMSACVEAFPGSYITIMAAAVADFAPVAISETKIKKETGFNSIKLKPTPDILSSLGKQKNSSQILVGFALETNAELANAQKKLKNKNLDMIVLNSLKDEGAGFGVSTNKITIITRNGGQYEYPLKPKKEVASDILDRLAEYI
jgi:phosphopantothenoylcysteine decarboxylase/phosphopantothenate--cysteine ligase